MRLRRLAQSSPQFALHPPRDLVGGQLIRVFHGKQYRMSKTTSGHQTRARMRRKQPQDSWPGRRTPDPKEAYSAVQLGEIGAIAIMWNAVDVMLDWLLKI